MKKVASGIFMTFSLALATHAFAANAPKLATATKLAIPSEKIALHETASQQPDSRTLCSSFGLFLNGQYHFTKSCTTSIIIDTGTMQQSLIKIFGSKLTKIAIKEPRISAGELQAPSSNDTPHLYCVTHQEAIDALNSFQPSNDNEKMAKGYSFAILQQNPNMAFCSRNANGNDLYFYDLRFLNG